MKSSAVAVHADNKRCYAHTHGMCTSHSLCIDAHTWSRPGKSRTTNSAKTNRAQAKMTVVWLWEGQVLLTDSTTFNTVYVVIEGGRCNDKDSLSYCKVTCHTVCRKGRCIHVFSYCKVT